MRTSPATDVAAGPADELDDPRLLRYSRHILLAEWGIKAQRRILRSHVLVVGAGGLGSPALLYLAAAGVGRLTVVDPDRVELTNLQRQIVHATSRIGQAKVDSAAQTLAALNADTVVRTLAQAADEALLAEWLPRVDLVLDCTDRFATRQLISRACVAAARPLVWAAGVRFDAQLSVFDPRRADCPCYACLFPPAAPAQEDACSTLGVFAPLVGSVGVLQAGEALKLLAGVGRSLAARLLLFDALNLRLTELAAARRPDCEICAQRPAP